MTAGAQRRTPCRTWSMDDDGGRKTVEKSRDLVGLREVDTAQARAGAPEGGACDAPARDGCQGVHGRPPEKAGRAGEKNVRYAVHADFLPSRLSEKPLNVRKKAQAARRGVEPCEGHGSRRKAPALPRRSSATGPEPDFSKQETGLAGVSRVICFPSGPGSKALESIGASYAPGVVWFRAAIFHWRGPTHASGTPPG